MTAGDDHVMSLRCVDALRLLLVAAGSLPAAERRALELDQDLVEAVEEVSLRAGARVPAEKLRSLAGLAQACETVLDAFVRLLC